MSRLEALGIYLRPPDTRPVAEIERDIDEELAFHIEMQTEENMAQGMSYGEARDLAVLRFGDADRIRRACRFTLIGERIMLQRIQVALTLLLILAVAVLGALFYRMNRSNQTVLHAMQAKLEEVSGGGATVVPATKGDIAGRVLDEGGQALPAADVLLILKTWPGGRYRQEPFAMKTDGEGRFRFAGLLPPREKYAVNVTVVKDGHALVSLYKLDEAGSPMEPAEFRLGKAHPFRVRVEDSAGKPIAGATVAVRKRTAPDGEQHLIYFMGSEPIWKKTAEDGTVAMTSFSKGDSADVQVRLPGADWSQPDVVKVPEAEGAVVVVKK